MCASTPLTESTQSISIPACSAVTLLYLPSAPPHGTSHLTWIVKSFLISFSTSAHFSVQPIPHIKLVDEENVTPLPFFIMLFIGFALVSSEKTERPSWSSKSSSTLLTSFPSSSLRPSVSLQHWLF